MKRLVLKLGVLVLSLGVLPSFGNGLEAIAAQGVSHSVPEEESTSGQASQEPEQDDLEEIRRQLDVLADEVERLRSGEPEMEVTAGEARAFGLGSSAASVYRRTEGVSIAGYGEMLLENFAGRDQGGTRVIKGTQFDFLRAVIYFGYRFNDRFLFNSEIEVEHANEIGLEFAYIDYLAHPSLSVRAGLLLVPMGLTNEFHEPNAFLSARRPETESRLIPSTWRENGAGLVGSRGGLSYRAYVVNGLDASGFGANGLRGGRQKGSKAKFTDPAFVGRVDVEPTPGVFVGGTIYVGDSSQDQFSVAGRTISVRTTIGEFHGQAQVRGFDVRALYARSVLDNVGLLNQARGLTGMAGVGAAQEGGYIQVGYNLLSQLRPTGSVTPFYRYEVLDTQDDVAPGFLKDPAMDREFHTLGVAFSPIQNVVIKADHQWIRNEANSGLNQLNVGLGYSF